MNPYTHGPVLEAVEPEFFPDQGEPKQGGYWWYLRDDAITRRHTRQEESYWQGVISKGLTSGLHGVCAVCRSHVTEPWKLRAVGEELWADPHHLNTYLVPWLVPFHSQCVRALSDEQCATAWHEYWEMARDVERRKHEGHQR